jgi:predicted RND superfamily exporter protein
MSDDCQKAIVREQNIDWGPGKCEEIENQSNITKGRIHISTLPIITLGDALDIFFRSMSKSRRLILTIVVVALWTLAVVAAFFLGWNVGEQVQ